MRRATTLVVLLLTLVGCDHITITSDPLSPREKRERLSCLLAVALEYVQNNMDVYAHQPIRLTDEHLDQFRKRAELLYETGACLR